MDLHAAQQSAASLLPVFRPVVLPLMMTWWRREPAEIVWSICHVIRSFLTDI